MHAGALRSRRHDLPRAHPALRGLPARRALSVARPPLRASAQAVALRGLVPPAKGRRTARRRGGRADRRRRRARLAGTRRPRRARGRIRIASGLKQRYGPPGMHTVAAVIDQGALTFDLAIPCEVFGLDRSDIASPWYRFLVAAAGDSPVRTQTGFDLSTPYTLRHLDEADTIVVPGWSDPNDLPSNALCAALRAAHARGARVVSLCTGAFVLAEAGLLAGRRATTHWMYVDRLRARHPDVELDPDVLYV